MLLKYRLLLSITAMSLTALIITGTYAWANLSTHKINEWRGARNSGIGPGGTLHDDYLENGENKNVYIENWGDVDLYVRIKLTEYMEVGQGAGLKSVSTDPKTGEILHNPLNLSIPIGGMDIDHLDTWRSIWYRFPEINDLVGRPDPQYDLNNYWTWEFGGQKYYFPAPEDKRKIKEYVDQNSPENLTADSMNNNLKAKLTLPSTVITMTEWKNAGRPIGDYWVIDRTTSHNNWAYWAEPLKPGDATGLLIKKVSRNDTTIIPGYLFNIDKDDYYYGINVEAQMATRDGTTANGEVDNYKSFGLAANSGWTTDGEALMEKIVNEYDNIVYIKPIYTLEDDITKIQYDPPLLNGVIYIRQGTSLVANGILDSKDDRTEFSLSQDSDIYYSVNNRIQNQIRIDISTGIYTDSAGKILNIGARSNLTAQTISNITGSGELITIPFIIIPADCQGVVFGKSGKVYIDYGNNTYQELKDDGSLGVLISIDELT